MAKSKEKNKARELRLQGRSIREIAKKLKVSKGSASIWCRDIELTSQQIEKLQKRMLVGSYKGRLKGARTQLQRRLKKIALLQKEGARLLGSLSRRDLFLIGTGLYWGEGSKQRRARITNSDPEVIKFAINWFRSIWKIPKDYFTLQVLINKVHRRRVSEVEKYWSYITGIPKSQFTKTTLIKAKNRKFYKNFKTHYGTLIISIRRGGDLQYKIMGLISNIIKKGRKFSRAA
jgi:hypothetical protein